MSIPTLEAFPLVRLVDLTGIWDDDYIRVRYLGSGEHLIALGLATNEMLSRRPHGERRCRNFPDGGYYRADRYLRRIKGEIKEWYRLFLVRPRELGIALPGVAEWRDPDSGLALSDVQGAVNLRLQSIFSKPRMVRP